MKCMLHVFKLLSFTNQKAIPVLQYQMRGNRQHCTGGEWKRKPADGVKIFSKNFHFCDRHMLHTCMSAESLVCSEEMEREELIIDVFL